MTKEERRDFLSNQPITEIMPDHETGGDVILRTTRYGAFVADTLAAYMTHVRVSGLRCVVTPACDTAGWSEAQVAECRDVASVLISAYEAMGDPGTAMW